MELFFTVARTIAQRLKLKGAAEGERRRRIVLGQLLKKENHDSLRSKPKGIGHAGIDSYCIFFTVARTIAQRLKLRGAAEGQRRRRIVLGQLLEKRIHFSFRSKSKGIGHAGIDSLYISNLFLLDVVKKAKEL